MFSCLIEPFAFCGMVSEQGNGLASEEKKLLLERYGLDPDEFLSEPPPPKVLSLSPIQDSVWLLRNPKKGKLKI